MIQPYYKAPYLIHLHRSGELRTVILYLVSGALTSATDYSIFWVTLQAWQDGLLLATVLAYIGGLLVSFLLNRYIVFRKNATGQQFGTSVWRYATLLIVNLIITYLMLWAMERWLGISPLIGKFVVWTFMIFWIYVANKLWVFKGPRQVRKKLFGM